MNSSTTQTTPQTRSSIRRVTLACIQCRSRKVRCDSTQPSCTRCQVDGKQCEYQKSRRGGRTRRSAPLNSEASNVDHVSTSESLNRRAEASFLRMDSGSSEFPSAGSSTSVSDGLEILSSLDVAALSNTPFNSILADQRLNQYYAQFHQAHPFVLPQWALLARITSNSISPEPLLPVMLYIGSIYTDAKPSATSAAAALQAINSTRTQGPTDVYYVQALLLYAIAVYWSNETERGRELLDEAINVALALGMYQDEFVLQHGNSDAVLEESWRRTWWQLYITDSQISGTYHLYPPGTSTVDITVGLPCEEELYESGTIPNPPSLRSYDIREFSDVEFSSFGHLVGFTQAINRSLTKRRLQDPDSAKVACDNVDTAVTAWCSLLPKSKRKLLREDGSVDELLFNANILMHTYIVDLHRELSNIRHCSIESVSQCAPPPPPPSNHLIKEDAHIHTAKVLYAFDKLNGLLTLPARYVTHTPFIICMISMMTVAHLSACRHVFKEEHLPQQRDRIRLNMGVLKMLGETWPAGKREYRDVGLIAREILSLADEEVQIPKEVSMIPLDTLDFNLDLDMNWSCEMFASYGQELSMDSLTF